MKLTQGRGKVWPPHSQLLKNCVYSDAERLYKHIYRDGFQTRALTSPQHQAWIKRARKRYRRRGASVELQWTAVRWDVVISGHMSVKTNLPVLPAVIGYCARSACSSSAPCTNVPARALLGYIKALYHTQTQIKLRVCNVVDMSSVKSWSYKTRPLKLP